MKIPTPRFLSLLSLLAMNSLNAAPRETIPLDPATRQKCLQVLREGLHGEDFWPSMHAAEALTLAGHGDEVRTFLEPKLGDEKDDQHRCGLARELARAGDRSQIELLLGILSGTDPYGHTHAAESLYKVLETGDGTALRKAMAQRQNPKLRLMAAGALGRKGDADAMALIRKQLVESTDPEEYKICAWLLAIIGNQSDIASLRSRLQDAPDELTKAYLEHALASLGDAAGLAALQKNLQSADPAVRTYAANFAADGHLSAVADQLRPLLADENLDTRIRSAQALLVISQP